MEATFQQTFTPLGPGKLIGDRAYDSDPLDQRPQSKWGVALIAPHKTNRSKPPTQDGRTLRRYRRRWKVERFLPGCTIFGDSLLAGNTMKTISSAWSNSPAS